MVAFFIVSLLMFFRKRIMIGIIILAVIGSIGLFVLPKPAGESVNLLRTFSIYSRLDNYKEALQDWSHSPVKGVGYNRIRYTRAQSDFSSEVDKENNHAGASYHSTFLVVLVTGGVIGLIFFIYLLVSFTKLSSTTLWSTVFLSLLSLTDNVLLHPFVLILFLLFIVGSSKQVSPSDSSP